jgi:heptosyltransferase II
MTTAPERVLVFHTAFIGDVVLMFPLLQVLRRENPGCTISVVCIPAVAGLVRRHPAVDEVVEYDKRGAHRGLRGMRTLALCMRKKRFTLALVPHRSLRSALIVWMARIPRRIGFATSAGARLFTDTVEYRPADHEIDRDLRLLQPVLGTIPGRVLPVVPPHEGDSRVADELLAGVEREHRGFGGRPLVALAPGSVWLTKRWPAEAFSVLARTLATGGCSVVLVGGERDVELCDNIAAGDTGEGVVFNAAGKTSLSESAALLRRCRVLVTNDSAPSHIAMSVGTPVLALFGPTVPAIGFAPVGPRDRVLEVSGLSCRPCSIHGGNECPIGSFECMRGIGVAQVMAAVREVISDQHAE